MALNMDSYRTIRSWNGSQANAFEELCYQLRDPTPEGATLWKLGNPDRGYEWYVESPDGTEEGWQVKYTFDIDSFLKLAEETLKKVAKERTRCVRLTFCIPFDLPDVVPTRNGKRVGKSALEKFEHWVDTRGQRHPGAQRFVIGLWSGGELLSRLNSPAHRGRAWFFWDQAVLSQQWCRQRIEKARDFAGPRYSEDLTVRTPIAETFDGLARTPRFSRERRSLQAAFNAAVERLTRYLSASQAPAVAEAIRTCAVELAAYANSDGTAFPSRLAEATIRCGEQIEILGLEALDTAFRIYLDQLLAQLEAINSHIDSMVARAAREGAVVITGAAGQGKTHLLVDTALTLVGEDHPAVLVLGGHLSGNQVLGEIAYSLGIQSQDWEMMLQGMSAAAQACGRPFVLMVDALNESDKPRGWAQQLPVLLAETKAYFPWIVVAVSVRSTYADLILRHITSELPQVEHQGFAGIEDRAIDAFFDHYGLAAPQAPLIGDAVSNPLFLKLYCEALNSGQLKPAEYGSVHISALFDRYIDTVNQNVCDTLRLDEDDRLVHRCVDYLAARFTESGTEWMDRGEAKRHITSLVPDRSEWPNTLFGQLLAEGLIFSDLAASDRPDRMAIDVVRFGYQRFTDFRVASMLLSDMMGSDNPVDLEHDEQSRARITDASEGVIEALSVLWPERFGIELLEAASWDLDHYQMGHWQRAFLSSLTARRGDALTTSTVRLFEDVREVSEGMFEMAAQTMIELSVHLDHPLGADYLHRYLFEQTMPQRDATWGIALYHNIDTGPLGRLIRWAARENHSHYPDHIVRRATVPLIWMLGTPHRPMRDHLTKSLTRLLSPRLGIIADHLQKFADVDDPYVFQRLCLIAHGSLLTSDHTDPAPAQRVVRQLAGAISRRTVPDLLARDALTGCLDVCRRLQLLTPDDLDQLPAPPRTELPLEVPSMDELFARYSSASPTVPGFISILSSVGGLGDFGTKIIDPDVRYFSFHPIDAPYPIPRPDDSDATVDAKAALNELRERLARQLQEPQTNTQERVVRRRPPRPRDAKEHFPPELARAWIVERVRSLGWTPNLFGTFDSTVTSTSSDSHKPERFGKKYQWIALHELLARIADNYHPRRQLQRDPHSYRGAWQIRERDIDPTLPPAPLDSASYRRTRFGATFPRDEQRWWLSDGPRYIDTEPPAEPSWTLSTDDVPPTLPLIQRTAPDGTTWYVLHSHHEWREEDPYNTEPDRNRRDQWSSISSWLVRKRHTAAVYGVLSQRTLFNKWMPEGHSPTTVVYLGEMPRAPSSNEHPQEWERGHGPDLLPHPVYPTWNEYCWESIVRDCSIDENVNAWMPSLELFDSGELTWRYYSKQWIDSTGQLAAQYFETSDQNHAALLARSDWLTNVLQNKDCSIIFGRLGEKQLLSPRNDIHPGLVGSWMTIDDTAVLYSTGHLKLGALRTEHHHQEDQSTAG
ncbi:hypothetical protein ACWEKT_38515 [Nocardia takedensis]